MVRRKRAANETRIGMVFNRLTILGIARVGMFQCRCECGNVTIQDANAIIAGRFKSCGCFNRELHTKHGQTADGKVAPEYTSWRGVLGRCTNPNIRNYNNYGGRGIKICERWLDFSAFLADMGPKPTNEHSIERINNDGDYEPSNCRWATPMEQARNQRSNVWVTFNGRTQCIADWAAELDINPTVLRTRLRRWPLELALTLPPMARGRRAKQSSSRTI